MPLSEERALDDFACEALTDADVRLLFRFVGGATIHILAQSVLVRLSALDG